MKYLLNIVFIVFLSVDVVAYDVTKKNPDDYKISIRSELQRLVKRANENRDPQKFVETFFGEKSDADRSFLLKQFKQAPLKLIPEIKKSDDFVYHFKGFNKPITFEAVVEPDQTTHLKINGYIYQYKSRATIQEQIAYMQRILSRKVANINIFSSVAFADDGLCPDCVVALATTFFGGVAHFETYKNVETTLPNVLQNRTVVCNKDNVQVLLSGTESPYDEEYDFTIKRHATGIKGRIDTAVEQATTGARQAAALDGGYTMNPVTLQFAKFGKKRANKSGPINLTLVSKIAEDDEQLVVSTSEKSWESARNKIGTISTMTLDYFSSNAQIDRYLAAALHCCEDNDCSEELKKQKPHPRAAPSNAGKK